jgi:ABC-type glycerol-3-phosphate transport system substrate-binding protein
MELNYLFFRSSEMKKMKKWMGLLLACSLALAGGCRGGSKTADAGGLQTIKILGIDKQYSLSGGQNLQLSNWYTGSIPSRIWEQFTADLAERGLKLELELVLEDQIGMVLSTTLAGGKLNQYDWVAAGAQVSPEARYGMIRQNRIYPLNKLIAEYSAGPAKEWYGSGDGLFFSKLYTVDDGNFYWLTTTSRDDNDDDSPLGSSGKTGMIRWDWLEQLGLPMPKTLDDFFNDVTAFRNRDVNGNGIADEEIYTPMDNFDTMIAQWFGLGNDLVSCIDYRVVSPWYQEHVKDYFAYMNKLYRAGAIQVNSEGNAMASNRLGFSQEWYEEEWVEPAVNTPPGKPAAYFAPFVIQAYPDTPPRIWTPQTPGIDTWGLWFVPSGTKKAAAIGKLLDYLVSPEYHDLTHYGIEGYTYTIDSNGAVEIIKEKNSGHVGLDFELVQSYPAGLWVNNSILPRYQHNGPKRPNQDLQRMQEVIAGTRPGYPLKAQFAMKARLDRAYPPLQDISGIAAYPTLAELERIAAIRSDLNTYHYELCTALVMGEKSLDNWDSYIADFKRLGLDELIAIYQDQVDRAR